MDNAVLMELSKQKLQSKYDHCKYKEQKGSADCKPESLPSYSPVSMDVRDETNSSTRRATHSAFHLNSEVTENDTISGVLSDIDKYKSSCTQCHFIIEQIKNLLQSAPIITRNNIASICHSAKTQSGFCNQCGATVKKFITNIEAAFFHEKEKCKNYPELWLRKKHQLLLSMEEKAVERSDAAQSRASNLESRTKTLSGNSPVFGSSRTSMLPKSSKYAFDSSLIQSLSLSDLRDDVVDETNKKLDHLVLPGDMVEFEKTEPIQNVMKLQLESRHSTTDAKTTMLKHKFSKNVLNFENVKETIIPKSLEVKSNDVKGNTIETEGSSVIKRHDDKVNQEVKQIRNTKFITNKQESLIKDQKQTSDSAKKPETNYLKRKEINKTITNYNAQVQTTKQEKSDLYDLSQKMKNVKINTQKMTKKFISSINNKLEERVELKNTKQEQSRNFTSIRFRYPERNDSKIYENQSNNNKFHEEKMQYEEKSHSGGGKNMRSKIDKDLIISSLPKDAKVSGDNKKPGPQKWSNGINSKPGPKQQKRFTNKIQKAGGDTHEYFQSKRNEIITQNLQPKQLLNKSQPIDHLRGGGPRLFKETKNAATKNNTKDRNKTELTQSMNVIEKNEPKQQINRNKIYSQQMQVQIVKDIVGNIGLQPRKLFSTDKNKNWRKKLLQLNALPIVSEHTSHKFKEAGCVICQDSELSLDLESFRNMKTFEFGDYIKNTKICTSITQPKKIDEEKESLEKMQPLLFKSTFDSKMELVVIPSVPKLKTDVQSPIRDGVLRYALSNREFIDKGWTVLPIEKITRKLNIYRMYPARPELNFFERNKNNYITYKTGEKLADSDQNGHGRWYYKNGQVALDYHKSKDPKSIERIVIYSKDGYVDQTGRSCPLTVLAIFDHTGNGIVFDHYGKIRLKYNQSEGLVLDRGIGPRSHWNWHSLNEPPNLETIIINEALEPRDENIMSLDTDDAKVPKKINTEVTAVEFENAVKEQQKAGNLVFNRFQIKTKALKLNKEFSLRIMDQEKIYIHFRDGSTHLKLNVGLVLDNTEITSVHTEDLGNVLNSVEKEPFETKSLEKLKTYIDTARHLEKLRTDRLNVFRIRRGPRQIRKRMVSLLYFNNTYYKCEDPNDEHFSF